VRPSSIFSLANSALKSMTATILSSASQPEHSGVPA
jgi:hypothetical protein